MENRNDSSSNGSNSLSVFSTAGYEPRADLDFWSKLDSNLEKLLFDAEYDYSDAEIVVEGISIGINQCILALRSQFFHKLFKGGRDGSKQEGKPKYLLSELVPFAKIRYESFIIILTYLYTGKLKPPPPEVATCIDDFCAHEACAPAINFSVELMYASVTFQMKELVPSIQQRLLSFISKAFVEDIIPIILVAFHCQLNKLLFLCTQRVAQSVLDYTSLGNEIPYEVCCDIKSLRKTSSQAVDAEAIHDVDSLHEERIQSIYKAMHDGNIEVLNSVITLDDTFALHYAVAYCDPMFVNEVLNLDKGNVNIRNSQGYTLLHIAARRKDPSIVQGLLSHGASVSQRTLDGRTVITICQRATCPKDYNDTAKDDQEIKKDRLCIDLLERELHRKPRIGTISMLPVATADDQHLKLLWLEDIVGLLRVLLPREARTFMETAHDSASAYKEVRDLNKTPSEERIGTLQKIVEKGLKNLPTCCQVLDEFLEKDTQSIEGAEDITKRKMGYLKLKDELRKAFDADKASNESQISLSTDMHLERARKLLRGNGGTRKMKYMGVGKIF